MVHVRTCTSTRILITVLIDLIPIDGTSYSKHILLKFVGHITCGTLVLALALAL